MVALMVSCEVDWLAPSRVDSWADWTDFYEELKLVVKLVYAPAEQTVF